MDSVAAIIDAFGVTDFGRVCGFEKNPCARASDMKRRGSIRPRYWPRVLAAAEKRGLPITAETLALAHAADGIATKPPEAGEGARP